jgi:hypothetical protein
VAGLTARKHDIILCDENVEPIGFETDADIVGLTGYVIEAEYTWPQFLRDYAAGLWQTEYRQDEKPSMLDSPLPRFDLLQIDRYRSMTIQFGRGCPFSCEFCASS